jgi:hypothetical protein
LGVVAAHNLAARDAARRIAAHDEDVAVPRRPLALDTQQARADIEDQVIPLSLTNWSVDLNAEPHRRGRDRSLGNVPFLVGSKHVVEASNGNGWATAASDNLQ